MGHVSSTLTVAAPREKVWEVITDPAGYDKWLAIHTKWKTEPPAPLAVGAQMTEVVTMLGMANTISWTVEELDAPARLVIGGTGMAGVRTTFTFAVEEGADGCEVRAEAEFTGQMIVGALGKAVEKDAVVNLDKSLQALAGLVA
ncbi:MULTISPECIES: SRPBCC family protein [unclassified Streptomyces]|uniref:type II toxin-antitoxin system Rv0910 family toxin n=1 Tax=unclassified Streptomyces TaxID=2593676 RepID=UPI0023673931|nr:MULTISPECIES: SRPBCC family protein [unclassified Streptomyces]MDF3147112.1 SRPBCC family protein [Streptomyces sp. T21Q-yed]WDF36058.1 SRPBCC family protein [Streptomyces sp. T12]